MLEALVILAAQATAPPPPTPPAKAAPPPLELLEFLGDWSDEEGKLIDGEATGDAKAVPPEGRKHRAARDPEGKTP